MHALKLCFVVSCVLTVANSEVALVIGGFGASDSVQVITKDATCLGLSSNPVIPKAPDGRVGWVGQVSRGPWDDLDAQLLDIFGKSDPIRNFKK